MPEALNVGKRMGAERVILTHFSQRYPHMPSALSGGLGSNVCLAFDFMRCVFPCAPRPSCKGSWMKKKSAATAAAMWCNVFFLCLRRCDPILVAMCTAR